MSGRSATATFGLRSQGLVCIGANSGVEPSTSDLRQRRAAVRTQRRPRGGRVMTGEQIIAELGNFDGAAEILQAWRDPPPGSCAMRPACAAFCSAVCEMPSRRATSRCEATRSAGAETFAGMCGSINSAKRHPRSGRVTAPRVPASRPGCRAAHAAPARRRGGPPARRRTPDTGSAAAARRGALPAATRRHSAASPPPDAVLSA